jgi:hypothetical protein
MKDYSEKYLKFLQLFHKEVEFGNIEGYDDIKDLVSRALDSDEQPPIRFGNSEIFELQGA